MKAILFLPVLREPACADDFNSRSTAFKNYFDTNVPNLTQTGSGPHRIGRTGFWAADGRFLNNDLVNGSNFMSAALGDADSETTDAGFSMWPAMDFYLRWNTKYPAIFTPAINNFFETQLTTNGTNYGVGATANQKMMLATARYLAGTVWGTGAFPAGSQYQASYGTGDPTGYTFVSNTIAGIPLYGFQEHDSLIYEQFTLGPIYTLEQFAPDPVLQHKAQMAFDWGVAELAGTYFFANWATASNRTEPFWVQNQPTESTIMTYLFFGGPTPASYISSYPSALYCMPGFQGVLPEVVMAATNRTLSYMAHTAAMRSTSGYNNAYFKTSYITPTYSLYSQAECGVMTNSDGSFSVTNFGTVSLSDPHQMQRWGVIWNAPNDETKFWITNPYNPVYSGSAPNIYIGTSISEETVQLGSTLAAVYNIPTNATKADWVHNGVSITNYQLLEGQVPTNYTAIIDNSATSGRLFLHYTNVLIALYISTNFSWNVDTNATNYFLIPANVAGLAVETASPTEYAQSTAALRLAAFCRDVTNFGSVNTGFLTGTNPEMIYTDRHSNALQITFGVGAKTNGQSIDYQQWPTIENPWMRQAQLGNLFIFGTNRTIVYNYNNWTETTNNRPVTLGAASLTATQNNFVNVDLAVRISDAETATSNLLFTAGNPTNGTVTLLADAHTVQFSPATNFSGAAGFSYTATDCGSDPRLVFYYNFQPPGTLGSNIISDISGNARDASMVTLGSGVAAYSSSVPANLSPFIQQSLRLNENNNGANAVSLARTVTTGNLDMTNGSWTFSTWFNRASQTNDNFIFYMGTGKGFGGDGDELQLYGVGNANRIALSHWNAANVQDVAFAPTNAVNTNEWHHVALVFQHLADGSNNLTMYLDGAAVATTNVVWALHQNYSLVFGGHNSTTIKTYRWFNGSLDDLALFRGALSTNEIARLAAHTVGHFGGWTVTNAVSVNVMPVTNTAPVLAAIPNRTINAGMTLLIVNASTDNDLPQPALTYALPVAPTNAVIGTNSGILTWRPAVAQASTTNQFSVTVTEHGTPVLSATQNFVVTVNPLNSPAFTNIMLANNRFTFQVTGDTGPDYIIQGSTNLMAWNNLFFTNSPVPPFFWTDTNNLSRRYYRLMYSP